MNFPEFPGSAFFLAFPYYLIGNPEFPGIFRHFPGEGFWGPQIAISGEDGVICWAAMNYKQKKIKIPGFGDFLSVERRKRKRKKTSGILIYLVSEACCCGLLMPNMIITKAKAKESLGELI